MKKAIICFYLSFSFLLIQAQKHTISGFVEDSISGESLISASVINGYSNKGILTNEYGFFSISTNSDKIQLDISYVGYKKQSISLNSLKNDTIIKVHLSPSMLLDEVVVVANKNEMLESSQVSMVKLDLKNAALLPVLVGENDLVKSIQLLPGVQLGTEGTGGLQIRGGSQGDNLVLLDGAPVYNVNHLMGFFSIFNTDAIQNVDLYKGGFPARYGGRLSSVIDIRMKEGNNQKIEGSGSVGLIASKLTLQGPIIKNKTSFIVSARRTNFDLLIKPFTPNSKTYFYDANAKINHRFSDKSRLFMSFYTGKDELSINMDEEFLGAENPHITRNINSKMEWGNITSSVRWNYIFNSKLFLNSTLIYSKYETKLNAILDSKVYNEQQELKSDSKSNLQNNSAMLDFSYFPNTQHSIKFGGSYTYLPIGTQRSETLDGTQIYDTIQWNESVYAQEIHMYAEDDIDITRKLKSNIGLHASFYRVDNTWYKSLEPRISFRYLVTPNLSFKVAYTEMNQYVYQYPNKFEIFKNGNFMSISANPEVWLPSTNKLPPQKSKQLVVGSFLSLPKGYNISIEGFYKTLSNVISDRKFSNNQEPAKYWEDLFELGIGKSYGIEFLVEKKLNKTTGWVAYTLSKTDRQFDNINGGKTFPHAFDRRHNLKAVINHKFSDKFDIGAVWVYGSGENITLADGQYTSNFNTENASNVVNDIPVQSGVNAYKMPAYHRLDIGMNFHKQKKWGERTWSMGVYNTFNHHNSFLIYVDYNKNNTNSNVLKLMALFPIIPYISYSFKF
jgi:hypothetical protein